MINLNIPKVNRDQQKVHLLKVLETELSIIILLEQNILTHL